MRIRVSERETYRERQRNSRTVKKDRAFFAIKLPVSLI